MQKQQHTVINQKCESNCPKPNLSAASFMKLRGVHVNSRVLIAHGCSCVFFIFFGCHLFSLRSGFPCPKRKIKGYFSWGSRAFFGYKMAAPRRANPTKKTSLDSCWFGWFFVSCAASWLQNLCLGDQIEIPEFLVSLDSMVICCFFKINLGLENPKSLANLGFEGHFLKSS